MKVIFLLLPLLLAVATQAETITAEVTAVNMNALTLTLDNGKTVKVARGDARVGYEGRQITGDLEPGDPLPTLSNIWPANPKYEERMATINDKLHADTQQRGRKAYRKVGESMPPFALWNQNGDLVTNETFKGRPLVVSFIFTRCKMAQMCPATTAKMVSLQNQAADAGLDDARFALISFDPEYDTPGIFNEYGIQRGANFETLSLLTGPKQATDDLMKQFGILTLDDEGTINHTSATLLIGPDGTILYRSDGPRWTAEEFMEKLKGE